MNEIEIAKQSMTEDEKKWFIELIDKRVKEAKDDENNFSRGNRVGIRKLN